MWHALAGCLVSSDRTPPLLPLGFVGAQQLAVARQIVAPVPHQPALPLAPQQITQPRHQLGAPVEAVVCQFLRPQRQQTWQVALPVVRVLVLDGRRLDGCMG